MKKLFISAFLIILFLLFAVFNYSKNLENAVIKIVTPTIIQVDLNNNKMFDEGEMICIPDVKSFSSDVTKFDDELAVKLKLSIKDALSIGYLSDEFADKTLSAKKVKLKFTGNKSNECKFANVYVNKQNYKDMLVNSGFAFINDIPANRKNFEKQLKKSTKLKLVILNHKSKKYHNLDCKYGLIAHDAVIILKKQLPQDAVACKFCHLKKDKHKKHSEHSILTYPTVVSSGSIKLYVTDFTTKLKPDKNCSNVVCIELVKQINMTNSAIDMAVYGYDDIPAVTNAIKFALKRGVKIRMVYDVNIKNENYYKGTNMLAALISSSVSDKSANNLTTNMLMHNKFMIFDNQRVATGSLNFSTTGLSGFNGNTFVVINSKELAQQYTDEFNQMYSGNFHQNKNKKPHFAVKLGTSIITPLFSPQDKITYNNIIPLVNNAHKYVYMPVFIITHYDLTDALISAKNRGVDVRVIIDATNINTCRKQLKKLRENRILVKTENYAGKMHSKSIIIDDKYVITGSMNFSKSGEVKNDENVLIIEDTRLAKFYKGFFEYTWSKIPNRYLQHNVRPEGKFSVGSCTDGVDNNFDGKIDKADVGCQ